MQVGVITISGRQVGVIVQGENSVETDTPPLHEGRSGNSMRGDDVEGSRPAQGFAPRGRAERGERSERRSSPAASPQSSDGMDAYGDGDGGKSRAKPAEKDTGTPYGVGSGNPFDRARFVKELEEKPWLREKIKRLSLGENQDKTSNLAVIESMMNRAAVRRTSLENQAKRHRQSGLDEGGYYAGFAKSYGPQMGEMADRNIDKALAGSNVSNYATDNSSGDLARRTKENGRFVHHKDYSGESFWSPGNAEPLFRQRWQEMRRAVEKYANPDPSVDGIAPPSMGLPGRDKQSSLQPRTRLASADPTHMPVPTDDFGYGIPALEGHGSDKIDDVTGPATLEDFKDRPAPTDFNNLSEREYRNNRRQLLRDNPLPKESLPPTPPDEDTPQS